MLRPDHAQADDLNELAAQLRAEANNIARRTGRTMHDVGLSMLGDEIADALECLAARTETIASVLAHSWSGNPVWRLDEPMHRALAELADRATQDVAWIRGGFPHLVARLWARSA